MSTGGDQGVLNSFFSTWATADISKHLPFIYNLSTVSIYSYLPAFKQSVHTLGFHCRRSDTRLLRVRLTLVQESTKKCGLVMRVWVPKRNQMWEKEKGLDAIILVLEEFQWEL